ncbi:hypothetical protein FRC15_004816 [Serendipita sp. 397]|nr:hypothetical protein FRC15_004816 [Serendipita sp. 397]KAG8790250.1 hypothetical protein FRC16_000980 [Serendipita sp. 398]
MTTYNGNAARPQAGSLQNGLSGIQKDTNHHIEGSLTDQTPPASVPGSPQPHELPSKGFWNDVVTMRWMRRPSSSIKMLGVPILLRLTWMLVTPHVDNPWDHLLFVSNRLPDSAQGFPMYGKSYWVRALSLISTAAFHWTNYFIGRCIPSLLRRSILVS